MWSITLTNSKQIRPTSLVRSSVIAAGLLADAVRVDDLTQASHMAFAAKICTNIHLPVKISSNSPCHQAPTNSQSMGKPRAGWSVSMAADYNTSIMASTAPFHQSRPRLHSLNPGPRFSLHPHKLYETLSWLFQVLFDLMLLKLA